MTQIPLGELSPEQQRVAAVVERYLKERLADSDEVVAVESDGPSRWMIRLTGSARDYTTIWFTVGERTLQYETYFVPDPSENHDELYRYLLTRSAALYCSRFSLADDRDAFITGQMPLAAVDEAEVDRIVGCHYTYVETLWRPAMVIAFGARFGDALADSEAGREGAPEEDGAGG